MTLAQLMKGDKRPVGEVLLDAVHVNDVLMNQLKAEVEGGDVSLDTVTRLIEASARAGKLAKVTIDAGVAVKLVEQRERNLELEGRLVTEIMTDVLSHVVNGLGLNAVRAKDVRDWALATMVARLGGPDVELPSAPYWLGIDAIVEAEVVEVVEANVPVVGATTGRDRAEMDDAVRQDASEDEQPSWLADVVDEDDDTEHWPSMWEC
jgi:hypothetical protein